MGNDAPELMPCPFCGSKDVTTGLIGYQRRGHCKNCGASSAGASNEKGAVAAWNRRAAQPAEAGRVSVKPLEWETSTRSGYEQANCVLGQYQVSWLGEFECWQLCAPLRPSAEWKSCFSRFARKGDAKAAAQADFDARILAALSPAPAAQEPETTENYGDPDNSSPAAPPAAPTDTALVEAKTEISSDDILRQWFGSERYARDPEYLDAAYGRMAQQVVDWLQKRAARASRAAPPDAPVKGAVTDRDAIAFEMWREEASVGTPGTFRRRTREAWEDQSDDTRRKWLRFADAALRALAGGRADG